MPRVRAELFQHFDFALVRAIHGPVQWPLPLDVLCVRIGSSFEKQAERSCRSLFRSNSCHQCRAIVAALKPYILDIDARLDPALNQLGWLPVCGEGERLRVRS